jgi:predicted DCC family thiol-disulfide oxidoreductase YuxK
MRAVTGITIVYDANCGLCTHLKNWIRRQPPLVGIRFAAGGSESAQAGFPDLPSGELAVVANTGEVWLGNRAWIVCLWALRDYRNLAVRLISPPLLLLAREAFTVVSRNRFALSGLLGLGDQRAIEQRLRKVAIPKCQTGKS